MLVTNSGSEAETRAIAGRLINALPDGTTIILEGTLGSGKTRFAQGAAEAIGVPVEEVTSPTFIICQTHQGQRTLHHLDVYRIVDEDEFLELGPEDWFDSPSITLIEWGERFAELLPANRLHVRVEVASENQREISIEATSDLLRQAVQTAFADHPPS